MTVYVDDMYLYPVGRFVQSGRQLRMSHLMADTTEELLAMVDTIGVQRKWIQHAGTPSEHFDIAMTKRALAIKAGAIPVTMREMSAYQLAKRKGLKGVSPPEAWASLRGGNLIPALGTHSYRESNG
jgi:hypothetical protein